MNISDIITKCYILALIIRDDGERLLLGDGFYEFTEQLQHFQPNTFQNDVIELQGTDGQLLAGQVRRGATQSFDGYIADSTISREATEEHRQRFLAFFRKKHHYKVVYVFPDGSAIKRERGYIVDAPSVPEMFQRFPEFHVGLNFEDVNYYEYEEGEDGDEIFAHVQNIAIAGYVEGGLIWDNYGAVSNEITWVDYALKTTTDGYAQITDGVLGAPLNLTQLFGNTTQIAYTGKNLWGGFAADKSRVMYSINFTTKADGTISVGAGTVNGGVAMSLYSADAIAADMIITLPAGTYTISGGTDTIFVAIVSSAGSQLYITTANNHERTFTLNDTTQCFLRVQIENGTTVAATTIYPMLVAGSSAGSYEPYTGSTPTRLQPSPNPDYPQTVNTVTGRQTIKIAGKNQLTFTGKTFATGSLTIQEIDSNSVTFTPSVGAGAYANKNVQYMLDELNLKAGDVITISADITGTYASEQSYLPRLRIYGTTTSQPLTTALSPSAPAQTFTIPDNIDRIQLYFYVRDGQTPASDSYATFSNIQIEFGAQRTSFIPYTAPATTEINLGQNLLNANAIQRTLPYQTTSRGITFTLAADGSITLNGKNDGTGNSTFTIYNSTTPLILAGGTYTGDLNPADGVYRAVSLVVYDGAHYRGFTNNSTQSLDASKASAYLQVTNGESTQFSNYKIFPQLEAGNQSTPFVPYITPIELCKIGTYRDRIYENDGEWYKHAEVKKTVLDGSEGWGLVASSPSVFYTDNTFQDYATSDNIPLSDHFMGANNVSGNAAARNLADNTMAFIGVTAPRRLYIRATKFNSVSSDFETWLSTHNTTVYYALNTPTDTKITDQTLIQELSTIKALVGETDNIWLIPSAGAQGEMEVRYSRGFINQGAGYVWDAAQGGGPNILSVDGIDRTGFVWEVVGPATNPTLTNITTNQTMTFEGDVATGQTLTVNTSDQTAEISGTNVFAQMEGDWMQLAPGNNVITYTATGATEPSKIKWNGVVG